MERTRDTKALRRYSPLQRLLKELERRVKGFLLALLMPLVAQKKVARPDWTCGKLRVLFLRYDRIGDMILTTGAIGAIAGSHPNIELDVLASPANAAILDNDAKVHRVIKFDVRRVADWYRLVLQLRRARYDMVVDCMVFSQSLTTMLLMVATGAPHRVGVVKQGKPNVYTLFAEPAGKDAHHVEHLAQLVVPFGLQAGRALKLHIDLTDAERQEALAQWCCSKRIMINISAGKRYRQWPDENFVAIATHLKTLLPESRIMILHEPGESRRAQSIAEAAGVTRAHTPRLRQALAMVATADFVVTPDTSILHAASAFRSFSALRSGQRRGN